MRLHIRRVSVGSVAKVMGVLYALLGLLIGGVFALVAMLGGLAELANDPALSGISAFLGIGSIIFFPIMYGILGLIGGLIIGVLYNIVSSVAGGIVIETDEA